jgi:membrane-associated phospholipid phosphatase
MVCAQASSNRRSPAAQAALARWASRLGDRGLIWLLLWLLRMRRPGPARRRALAGLAFTGIVTPVVNLALKAVVKRPRPVLEPGIAVGVRVPMNPSFPSGHALAAWCAASMLGRGCRPVVRAAYGALALVVSWSRVKLRLHHPTDVFGGALIGVGLGAFGNRLVASVASADDRMRPPQECGRRTMR